METLAVGLPPGWTVHWSKSYGRPYYFHTKRNERQWERPGLPAPAQVHSEPTEVAEPTRHVMTMTDAVQRHYSALRDAARGPRSDSIVATLRKLNNWVKAAAFAHYTSVHGGFSVCDLACGKGADLGKWARLGATTYVGIDITVSSVLDAKGRATMRKDAMPEHTYFVHGDMTALSLLPSMERQLQQEQFPPHMTFPVVSCQYALHYAFDSLVTVSRTLGNIAHLLSAQGVAIVIVPDAEELVRRFHAAARKSGQALGTLAPITIANDAGTPVCIVTPSSNLATQLQARNRTGLRYTFWLADCIDACDEFLVCPTALASYASGAQLRVRESANVATFARARGVGSPKYSQTEAASWERVYKPLWTAMGLDVASPSAADWAIASLYRVLVLQHARPSAASAHVASAQGCLCHAGADAWVQQWDTAAVVDDPAAIVTASSVLPGTSLCDGVGLAVGAARRRHVREQAPHGWNPAHLLPSPPLPTLPRQQQSKSTMDTDTLYSGLSPA